jgi:type IV secretory pathway VirB3-like protein
VTVQPIREPQDHKRPVKQAQRAKARRQKELDDGTLSLRIDGQTYSLNRADVTGVVEYEIRGKLGMSVTEIAMKLQTSPGMDLIGMFMWAVRYINGERDLDFMEVLAEVSMDIDVEFVTNPEPAPKA